MRPSSALVTALVLALAPSALDAQRPSITLEPHVGWMGSAHFYRGLVGNDIQPTSPQRGSLRLEPALAWGARLAARPSGSPWGLALVATTSETYSILSTQGDPDTGLDFYRIRTPARLTMMELGVARDLRSPTARMALTGRLAASVASVTFQPRRYRFDPQNPPSIEYFLEQDRKPWNRRYVSPGASVGLDASWRVLGGMSLVASGTVGAVRNETRAMVTAGRSVDVIWTEGRDSYWMPVGRATLGVGLSR